MRNVLENVQQIGSGTVRQGGGEGGGGGRDFPSGEASAKFRGVCRSRPPSSQEKFLKLFTIESGLIQLHSSIRTSNQFQFKYPSVLVVLDRVTSSHRTNGTPAGPA